MLEKTNVISNAIQLTRTFASKNPGTFVQKSWNVISNVSYIGRIERVMGEGKEESEQRD